MTKQKTPTNELSDQGRGKQNSPDSTATAQEFQKALKDYMLNLVRREASQSLPDQWINDAEFNLWDLVQLCDGSKHQTRNIQSKLAYHSWTTITEGDILRLKELSKAAGAWCFWGAPDTRMLSDRQLVCIPISDWEQMHGRRLDRYIDQEAQRRRALKEIIQLGYEPYPHKFERTHSINQIVSQFSSKTGEELEDHRVRVLVSGRIHAINKMGKAAFIRFSDGAELLQIYIKSNEVDERNWTLFKLLDLGDFIGTEGRLFRTRTGELSIHAESLTFLSKALIPPPDKYYGLHEIELRYRQRYADLIASREVRRVFETRSQIIRLIRRFFDDRGYMEVETPMLTSLPTGAAARPFKTHHNALDIDLYARIAPELYLKRLIVGGFEKVYEINRNFRNEGIDRSHNPEFTMLEWYEAYSEYEDLLKLTEELIATLVEQVRGSAVIDYGENRIDFARPWKRLTMREAVIHYWPDQEARPTLEDLSSSEGILLWAERNAKLKTQIPHFKSLDYGHLLGEVFEHIAEGELINPTFITEFPTELSPLSKQNQDDPRFVDRFELFISGMEIANAFCEINDPVDQRRRFEAQMKLRERGDDEAMVFDEDYIRALSYGMPPTAGEGVGIDRLVMVLTNQKSIRDVILFPHMRPEKPVVSSQWPVKAIRETTLITDH
jgi:lysyl-tRNA synthetase, class II